MWWNVYLTQTRVLNPFYTDVQFYFVKDRLWLLSAYQCLTAVCNVSSNLAASSPFCLLPLSQEEDCMRIELATLMCSVLYFWGKKNRWKHPWAWLPHGYVIHNLQTRRCKVSKSMLLKSPPCIQECSFQIQPLVFRFFFEVLCTFLSVESNWRKSRNALQSQKKNDWI